ncbi:DUF862 domain-containing protein [Citrus sinensis]|uniref:UPF0481 protein At3g47200-like n=1 Tax=Citrus sinensis TaxID=2711 RepID=UPI002193EDB0|nr:UPF0481 protein At3g47200-like [Citrus sinensis]XP_052293195.1 UPF0481 protein At3g47200-like [Citrus sinensis]KAH9727146.1 DUF862 domain-containing protein [Citrus sinensis]
MENGEHHQSVNIDRLADTLRGKFRSLHRLPQKCCIYRVPQQIRGLNPKAHTPQLVSIGPFHHGDSEELRATEEIKIRYLEYFLQRTEVSIETFLADVKNKEEQLRDCYAETIRLENEDFITMVLEDAVFLIEFLLRYSFPNLVSTGDPIFTKSRLISNMWLDIWLLENQLPLFILDDLFNLAKTAVNHDSYNGVSLLSLTRRFYKDNYEFPLMEANLFETHFKQAQHFLDLLRLCFQPPQPRSCRAQNKLRTETQNIPTAMQLHQAGVKFQLGSSANLFDITFNVEGILEIPLLRISESTEILFRNLQAFERLHCGTRYINDYVIIMNYLVNTAHDVDLLVQNRVIENWLWNSEAVSNLFHNLVQETSLSAKNFQYTDLVEDLRAYCRYRWHRWKAMLRQDYFNSPWASISVIAAVILLLLTLIQAICSIIAL